MAASVLVHAQLGLPRLPANPWRRNHRKPLQRKHRMDVACARANWQATETMSASIIKGKVACNGAHDQVDETGSQHVALNGSGLFDITFGTQRGRSYYVFEVACPSVDHPTEANWADSHSSYKRLGKFGDSLTDNWTDGGDDPVLTGGRSGGSDPFDSTTDAADGVTETTRMVWQLLAPLTGP